MLRSGTVNTIRELAVQGKPVRAIARELGVARNTVRRYVRGTPEAQPRPRRGSQLDPYKDQIQRWVREDHLLNCETMYRRLQTQGSTGRISILKDFVRPLRPPAAAARRPVGRSSATRRNRASSCTATGESSSTNRRARPARCLALRRCSVLRGCGW
jgi:transposase